MLYFSAADQYLTVCRSSGKSVNTIDSYSRTLKSFGDFLSSVNIHLVENITPAVLVNWKMQVSATASSSSLRLYVAHLKGFFDFCTDIEFVQRNPFKKKLMEVAVKESDVKDTTAHVLAAKHFRQICTVDKPSGMHARTVERNRAILLLFLTSGIRCSSLCRLTFSDLFMQEKTIRIRNAKGGKNGEVLLSTVAASAVNRYLRSGYIPEGSGWSQDAPLFGFVDASGAWTPYSREQMSGIVELSVRGFTGQAGFRAHALRHTCASLLSANGLSDGEVSTLLMHSDGTGARVTNRYIDRSNAALFNKADRIFQRLAGTLE